MEAPRITYYARVIDNVSGEQVLDFTDAMKNNIWYYGQCNGLVGGQSQYIVEFDIWNNEPAFNANTYDVKCENAINCRLTVWPDKDCKIKLENELFNLTTPFMYAKTDTFGYKENYVGIKHNVFLKNITGNVNPGLTGVIQGNGDHAKIQTKIILPEESGLTTQRYSFVFAFYYEFQ